MRWLATFWAPIICLVAFSFAEDAKSDFKPIYRDAGESAPMLKGIQVLDGWKAELVLEHAELENAIQMQVAANGTVFALVASPPPIKCSSISTEAIETRYRDGTIQRQSIDVTPIARSVRILPANTPVPCHDRVSAILALDDWLYCAGRGRVERFRIGSSDRPIGEPELVLHGFAAQIAGLAVGPDRRLNVLVNEAETDPHRVEGTDGSLAAARFEGGILIANLDGSNCSWESSGSTSARSITLDDRGRAICWGMKGLVYASFGYWNRESELTAPEQKPTADLPKPLGWANWYWHARNQRLHSCYSAVASTHRMADGSKSRWILSANPDNFLVEALRIYWSGGSLNFEPLPEILRGTPDARPFDIQKRADGSLNVLLSNQKIIRLIAPNCEPPKSLPTEQTELLKIAANADADLASRCQAITALALKPDAKSQAILLESLQDGEPDIRLSAVEALGRSSKPRDATCHDTLLIMLSDPEIYVRRAAGLAIARVGAPSAAEVLINALRLDESKNEEFRSGIRAAIEQLGRSGTEKLLELADSGAEGDLDLAVACLTQFRSASCHDALLKLVSNPHLSIEVRCQIIEALRPARFPGAQLTLQPLLEYLGKTEPESVEVRLAACRLLANCDRKTILSAERLLLSWMSQADLALKQASLITAAKGKISSCGPTAIRMCEPTNPPAIRRTALAALKAIYIGGNVPLPEQLWSVVEQAALSDDREGIAHAGFEVIRTLYPQEKVQEIARKMIEVPETDFFWVISELGKTAEGAILPARRMIEGKLPSTQYDTVKAHLDKYVATNAEAARLAKLIESRRPTKP